MAGSSFAVRDVGASDTGGGDGKKRGRDAEDDDSASCLAAGEKIGTHQQRKKDCLVGSFKAWRNVRQRFSPSHNMGPEVAFVIVIAPIS